MKSGICVVQAFLSFHLLPSLEKDLRRRKCDDVCSPNRLEAKVTYLDLGDRTLILTSLMCPLEVGTDPAGDSCV